MNPQTKISAQVILAAASGLRMESTTAITSQNIEQFRPSPDAASSVKTAFEQSGFETGPMSGNSFSISGAAKVFETFFKTKLKEGPKGGLTPLSLPLDSLPANVKEHVTGITFTAPPGFGPTGY